MAYHAIAPQDLPLAIAQQERKIARMREQLRTLREAIAREECRIEKDIAFNPELKNDAQRRAKRSEMIAESETWADLSTSANHEEGKLRDAEIDLELMRNQFAVWKLSKREAIAQMESAKS